MLMALSMRAAVAVAKLLFIDLPHLVGHYCVYVILDFVHCIMECIIVTMYMYNNYYTSTLHVYA